MENNGRPLPTNDSFVEQVATNNKPLCGRRSNFFVATTQREILGGALHRTELPPTLQGFFYGDGDSDDDDDRADPYLPCKNYGRFASLPGGATTTTSISIDPSLSFLRKALPGNPHVFLIDSCNGLLLLGHVPESYSWPEFAVCNPATEQWAAVPTVVDWVDDDLLTDPRNFTRDTHISLLFDPAVSSHFQVLLFWNCHLIDDGGDGRREGTTTVHAYSSETGAWRNDESHWSPEERRAPWELWRRQTRFDRFVLQGSPGAFLDGMLYLNLAWCQRIIQVDTDGKTRGIFRAPPPAAAEMADATGSNRVLFVGRSQGRLHCIVEEGHGGRLPGSRRCRKKWVSDGLSLWVLVGDMDDDGRREWVRKHNKVKRRQLFGNRFMKWDGLQDYRVVTMHPDCDMVFFLVQRGDDRPMISYDFDRGEVRVVDTYRHHASDKIIPFVPYLSELFVGVLGAHKGAQY